MPNARSETELSESLASQLPQCVAPHNKSVFNTSPCGSGLARDGVSSGVGYALLPGRIAAVYENRVKLIPLQPRYRLQQQIGVVFLKAKERDPNLLALLAECRMYANRGG